MKLIDEKDYKRELTVARMQMVNNTVSLLKVLDKNIGQIIEDMEDQNERQRWIKFKAIIRNFMYGKDM